MFRITLMSWLIGLVLVAGCTKDDTKDVENSTHAQKQKTADPDYLTLQPQPFYTNIIGTVDDYETWFKEHFVDFRKLTNTENVSADNLPQVKLSKDIISGITIEELNGTRSPVYMPGVFENLGLGLYTIAKFNGKAVKDGKYDYLGVSSGKEALLQFYEKENKKYIFAPINGKKQLIGICFEIQASIQSLYAKMYELNPQRGFSRHIMFPQHCNEHGNIPWWYIHARDTYGDYYVGAFVYHDTIKIVYKGSDFNCYTYSSSFENEATTPDWNPQIWIFDSARFAQLLNEIDKEEMRKAQETQQQEQERLQKELDF